MIVEPLASGMAKNLNLSVEFALSEGLNDTFETNGRKERKEFNHGTHWKHGKVKSKNKNKNNAKMKRKKHYFFDRSWLRI